MSVIFGTCSSFSVEMSSSRSTSFICSALCSAVFPFHKLAFPRSHFFFGIECHPFFCCGLAGRSLRAAQLVFVRLRTREIDIPRRLPWRKRFVIRQLHGLRDR